MSKFGAWIESFKTIDWDYWKGLIKLFIPSIVTIAIAYAVQVIQKKKFTLVHVIANVVIGCGLVWIFEDQINHYAPIEVEGDQVSWNTPVKSLVTLASYRIVSATMVAIGQTSTSDVIEFLLSIFRIRK